jgi:SAM-dependent methyltransferase
MRLAERPDPAEYMKAVAALPGGQVYKSLALSLLELSSGLTVLDAGCGPGTDLPSLRESVGGAGRVVGIDVDPSMLSRARGVAGAELVQADLNHLPLADEGIDRIKADRVLQHVGDPVAVLAELNRVSTPRAVAVIAEPDWGSLAVDSVLPAVSAAFTRFTCEQVVRNPRLGRELGRLAGQVGWARDHVAAVTTTFDDFDTADRVLGLGRNSRRAVAAGYVSEDERAIWLAGLADGPVYAAATIVITRLLKVRG